MSTHKVCFYGEIRKIFIPDLSTNTPQRPLTFWFKKKVSYFELWAYIYCRIAPSIPF